VQDNHAAPRTPDELEDRFLRREFYVFREADRCTMAK
jgi:hypothetical protein